MSDIKAIIFDLDGVLVFTDVFHTKAWIRMAEKYGVEPPENVGNLVRGVGRMDALEIVLGTKAGNFSWEEKQEMADFKNDYYKELLETTDMDIGEERKHTLDELRKQGYQLAIGSSSKNTKTILKKAGLENFFDAVADGNDITKSKPDPEVFLKAAEFLGVPAGHCAVVEDAHSGIEAAKAAGMLAVAIGDAVTSGKKDVELTTFSDLLKFFVIASN